MEVCLTNLNPGCKKVPCYHETRIIKKHTFFLINTIKNNKMNLNLTTFHPVIIIDTQYCQIIALPPAQEKFTYNFLLAYFKRSRGSSLAFGTQVRGFKPGRSLRIFQGEKILSTPSFGGEVKPSVQCRRFEACKRSLKKAWKSLLSAKICEPFLAQ